jgi:hypothetical protein
MQTDFPTVELYFAFAFTYCRLRVYVKEENFARRVLEANEVEFLEADASKDWQDIDTRLLSNLVREALPKLVTVNLSWRW